MDNEVFVTIVARCNHENIEPVFRTVPTQFLATTELFLCLHAVSGSVMAGWRV